MAFFLDNLFRLRLPHHKKRVDWNEYEDFDPKWLDNLVKEKKRGPGRPKGSKNKPKTTKQKRAD